MIFRFYFPSASQSHVLRLWDSVEDVYHAGILLQIKWKKYMHFTALVNSNFFNAVYFSPQIFG